VDIDKVSLPHTLVLNLTLISMVVLVHFNEPPFPHCLSLQEKDWTRGKSVQHLSVYVCERPPCILPNLNGISVPAGCILDSIIPGTISLPPDERWRRKCKEMDLSLCVCEKEKMFTHSVALSTSIPSITNRRGEGKIRKEYKKSRQKSPLRVEIDS